MRKNLFLASFTLLSALLLLGSLLGLAANPQGDRREFDLRSKFQGKRLNEGRNTIETLSTGEKLVVVIQDKKFRDILLIASDGKEAEGKVNDPSGGRSERKRGEKVTVAVDCTATFITTTTDKKGNTTTTTTVVQIPCPADIAELGGGDTYRPPKNSNSNSSSKP